MKSEQSKFIHDTIADLLKLPQNRVIWARQNGIRLRGDFATLRLYGHAPEAMAEQRRTGTAGEVALYVPWRCMLEVQYYGANAQSALAYLIQDLEKPSVTEQCFANRVAFFDASPVQDLTALLDGVRWETRAAVDLSMRYGVVRRDVVGYVTKINLNGGKITAKNGEE